MSVKKEDFLRVAQARAARIAVNASSTRGQGKGVVKPARTFFCGLQLAEFSAGSPEAFRKHLDEVTNDLLRRLPKPARNWGLARKLTNIFLRDALYTTYLCAEYKLGLSEPFLELPLDSICAKALRKSAGRGKLPRWKGVKHLKPDDNERFQQYAAEYAKAHGLMRIHLDTYWWGERAD